MAENSEAARPAPLDGALDHRQSRLLVSVATYNERENLPPLLEALWRVCPDASVLVVDDNSPDGTGQWAQQYAATEPRLQVVVRPGKLGLGSAIALAMRTAIQQGFDFFAHLDADGSHDPEHLPAMLAALQGAGPCSPKRPAARQCDCVIGSRYVRGGRVVGWPLWRKVISRALNTYARMLLGLPVRDCSSGYRLYRTVVLKRIDFARLHAQGYAFLEEILWHLHRAGCTFCEVPITFINRKLGRSKINSAEALAALWHILRLALNRRVTGTTPADYGREGGAL
jgi:dolichol-phosphate mannosyltransferase